MIKFCYFPPTYNGGRKSSSELRFCLKILPKLHLVYSSHHGAVDSASAWQTRGRWFEPVLMRYIFSGKYPGA